MTNSHLAAMLEPQCQYVTKMIFRMIFGCVFVLKKKEGATHFVV